MKRSLLVGVDGSETGLRAVDWATGEAVRRGYRLDLLTAFTVPVPKALFGWSEQEARENAAAALVAARHRVRAVSPDVEVASTVLLDSPASALVHRAESAAMVAVGLRGRGGFPGLGIGSVADQVAAHAPVPVVVVGPEPAVDDNPEIVVGLDGSSHSEHALEAAYESASIAHARLRAIRAWVPPILPSPAMQPLLYDTDAVHSAEAAALAQTVAPWRDKYPSVPVVTEVVESHPVTALAQAAARARLIVVGARGRLGFPRLRLGGTAHGLLHHAPCPVMIVHS